MMVQQVSSAQSRCHMQPTSGVYQLVVVVAPRGNTTNNVERYIHHHPPTSHDPVCLVCYANDMQMSVVLAFL